MSILQGLCYNLNSILHIRRGKILWKNKILEPLFFSNGL